MTRNLTFVAVFLGILALYGLINYYIGLRGWQTIGKSIPWINAKIYWLLFWVIAFSYILVRLIKNFMPVFAERGIAYIGSYWMAAFYYLFFIILVIDLVRFFNRRYDFLPELLTANGTVVGWVVLLSVISLLAYGTWNARNPVVTHYEVNIDKAAGKLKELHVVAVSDVHLGLIMDNKRLEEMVTMVSELEPDIVLLPGDIIDESIEPFIEEKMADTFKRLKPPLGVYMVPGNHEYIGEDSKDLINYMKEGGVEVLTDRYVKLENSFYVVGRDDTGHGSRNRKSLHELLEGADKSLPLIMLDHNPNGESLREAREAEIDLQLSGHTHTGQFFPNNLITARMFENDRGHLREGRYQLIVSNGFGTWGPPIRIGNRPEIVNITIRFYEAP